MLTKTSKPAKQKEEAKEEKTKPCSRCQKDLPMDMYYNDKKSKDGKQAQCNDCKRIRAPRTKKAREERLADKNKQLQSNPVVSIANTIESKPVPTPIPVIDISNLFKNKQALKYNKEELAYFKSLILEKIELTKESLGSLRDSVSGKDNNGTNNTAAGLKLLEDSSDVQIKEEMAILGARQERFLNGLKDALRRIEMGTYGICQVTGKLIPYERLRVVPHATKVVEIKNEHR